MQAIQCKYIGPTNSRGSRIKAECAAGSITIDYPHELSGQACFRAAAEALVEKLGWTSEEGCYSSEWLGGCLKNGDYVFVCNDPCSKD